MLNDNIKNEENIARLKNNNTLDPCSLRDLVLTR